MKTIILVVTATAISLTSCGQEIPASKVPSVVQNTIQSKFTGAVDVEWEKEKDFYEAEFKVATVEYKAHIDGAGKLMAYKTDIKENEMPGAVTTAISTGHPGYKIDDVEKLEKDGITYYQVELDSKGTKDLHLVYAADGNLAANIEYML